MHMDKPYHHKPWYYAFHLEENSWVDGLEELVDIDDRLMDFVDDFGTAG